MRPDRAPLRAGIALHVGDVPYGNVGAGGRRDFTAIGRDVNLLSRIAGLCGPLGQGLLASAAFAAELKSAAALQPIGAQRLRGFAEAQEVFARAAT